MQLLRQSKVCGPQGKLPVGRTKFHDDYVYREGGPEFITGTKILRLRPVRLGARAVGFLEDEVDAVIEGLRSERDKRTWRNPPSKPLEHHTSSTRAAQRRSAP